MAIAVGWIVFLCTVEGTGLLLLSPFRTLGRIERAAAAFVAGGTALPLALFSLAFFFGLRPLAPLPVAVECGAILAATAALGVPALIRRAVRLLRPSLREAATQAAASYAAAETAGLRRSRPRRAPIPSILAAAILAASFAAFAWQISSGVTAPLFGWDEYSFWLYAAKALYLAHGRPQILLHDAYATYPLGFPLLAAWMYALTDKVSIQAAKWITPLLTGAMLIALQQALRRSGYGRTASWLAVGLTAWGTKEILWYNWLAFGEMAYVNTYTLANLYAALWLRSRSRTDGLLLALFLGLSVFLRVDGLYVAAFTLALLAGFSALPRRAKTASGKTGTLLGLTSAAAIFAPPAVIWYAYRFIDRPRAGWITRISWPLFEKRLEPGFLGTVLAAMWRSLSDLHTYPIMIFLAALLLAAPFSRRRESLYLAAVSIAQIAYLFAAYLTVFSRFEALHASSFDRYLLRDDPLIALAFVLWIARNPPSGTERGEKDLAGSESRLPGDQHHPDEDD